MDWPSAVIPDWLVPSWAAIPRTQLNPTSPTKSLAKKASFVGDSVLLN